MKKGGLAMRCLAAVAGMTAILAWAFPAGAVLSEEELRFRAMEERIQALE
ncbi:MAG: hypothetical protein GWN72_22440, partial [Nitrospinaceae bacterium]|nr:hypothetical protein [Nitrospinaceae bacterium]